MAIRFNWLAWLALNQHSQSAKIKTERTDKGKTTKINHKSSLGLLQKPFSNELSAMEIH